MRTGIEQARIDLAKWEDRAAEDARALADAEKYVQEAKERATGSARTADNLRRVVQQWDAMKSQENQK